MTAGRRAGGILPAVLERVIVLDFASDNVAGLCPEARDALVDAAAGPATPYGDDEATAAVEAAVRERFGPGTATFLVPTGTAANTLALAALTRPWQRILCEEHAHVAHDEATAPERLTGCRVVTIAADGRKLVPDDLVRRDAALGRSVHQPAAGVVTISNPTEFGEVYTPDEVAGLARAAHRLGYRLHVDGARFANAVAALGCAPRELAGDAGVDALSLGGTKNGLALGEALLILEGPAHAEAAAALPHLRKASGHLLSKHRYVAAPFAAVLADDAWLRHAGHANAMARRLATGLADAGLAPAYAVDANGVFVPLPTGLRARLAEQGWTFHLAGHPEWGLARFMTSFATRVDEVDALLAAIVAAR